jgi:predicted nuclease of predicted toxin-antitoxin system
VKLLLDENLSDRIVPKLEQFFPGSSHVKSLGLAHTDDRVIWEFARENGFVLVSKDADFHQRSLLFGHPPKLVFLRIGNCPTRDIIALLLDFRDTLSAFSDDTTASILILSPKPRLL